jgi:alpha-aminoadipic semialdehyde synthase
MATIGIRREDKSIWERRAPLVPEEAERLVRDDGVRLLVQPSSSRIFVDDDYRAAGAVITENLSACDVILGIKEIARDAIQPAKTYMFFSHTVKGQPHNMPMLRSLLDRRCSLLDHELVTDDRGRRLIAFGRHAGLAAALDALWILGRRLRHEGTASPFEDLRQSIEYADLDDARAAIRNVGEAIRKSGLPDAIRPLVIGVTGRGNVGTGVREMLDLLPIVEIRPVDLPRAAARARDDGGDLVVVHWTTEELVEPVDSGRAFSRSEYAAHPDRYRARLAQSLPHLTLLFHGIQWSLDSPRLVSREHLREMWDVGSPRLRVVADITCDVDGSLECTVRTTDPGDPAYVYDPATGRERAGIAGRGVVVVPVDIFPTEFPRDASRHFSRALGPMVAPLARMNPELGPEDPALPPPLRRSAIAVRGRLLPHWDRRLRDALRSHGGPGRV